MNGSDFVGRSEECRSLTALLSDHPLVTLVGPGGVGKTRLATEMSRRAEDRYAGGVLLAELSGHTDRDDIAAVVAAQNGFESIESMRLSRVTMPTLFVLDNCESALEQCSAVAAELVAGGGTLTVLATSRAPLRLYGERVVPLDPLRFSSEHPDASTADAPAVRLFLDRALQAGATWPHSDAALSDVATLVQRLDGLPLAIELAAARSRMLTPAQLIGRMDRQLDVLARPGADSGDRHSSVRRAIEGSYELLGAPEQRLVCSLAAIPTLFDLGLAHGVDDAATDDLETLDRLTSLVEAGDLAAARERYCVAVLDFADRITAEAMESFSEEVLSAIRTRYVHLMAAIDWCLEHDEAPDRAYRLFLPMYGPTGSRREVASLGTRIRERWSAPAPLQAEALAVMATTTFLGGENELATELAADAVDHPEGTPLAKMIGHRTLGFLAAIDFDAAAATTHLEAAIDLAGGFSDAFRRELTASWGAVMWDRDRVPEVLEVLEVLESTMAESAAAGDRVSHLWALVAASHQLVIRGDLDHALLRAERAVDICEGTGLPWSVATSHRILGSVLMLRGDWEQAKGHFRTAFESSLGVGDIEGVAVTIRVAVGAANFSGHTEAAASLWRTVPPGRGRSVLRSFFLGSEAEVADRLGPPVQRPMAEFVAEVRTLFGPPHEGPAQGGRSEAAPVRVDRAPDGRPLPSAPPPGEIDRGAGRVRYRFGDVEVDRDMRTVRRDGEAEHVEPQVFDLLVFLIENQGRVVPKEEILEEVWGDRFVSKSAPTSRIRSARRATGDDGRTQGVIRTSHGKGYAFVADLVQED